ncbi:MAG: GAF domain-containing protein [Thermoplasmata archaeon]
MTIPQRQVTPALLQIDAIKLRLTGRNALQEVCRYLSHEFLHFRWVGVYRLEGETLVLEGWDGPQATEHTRIPIGQGICGQAARENRSVVVDDVRSDPLYLACFLETRAEIVVPIRFEGSVIGEIDIDGITVKAFDATDQRFLESVAVKLVAPLQLAAGEPRPPS